MKGKLYNILAVLVFVAGLSLLLYPTISNYYTSYLHSRAIALYADNVENLDQERNQSILEEARQYNAQLSALPSQFQRTEEMEQAYWQQLKDPASQVMAFVEIPSIGVTLPILHGTSDEVLDKAVGHLEWTSLPVGGESSHCVVSGHRGLPSAKLFTDLDQLAVGDYFMMHILDETLTYEVDQIRIVEPNVTEDLLIQQGKDLCTLVTCTPYGINSHRMLVRGHRVDNLAQAQQVRVTADAVIVEKLVVAPFVLVPILLLMLLWLLATTRKRKK